MFEVTAWWLLDMVKIEWRAVTGVTQTPARVLAVLEYDEFLNTDQQCIMRRNSMAFYVTLSLM